MSTDCSLGPQDALLACVGRKVPLLLSRGLARLVVLDSVAAPFRCEFASEAAATRAQHLRSLGAALRRLSCAFRSPVLCVNQVCVPIPPTRCWGAAAGCSQLAHPAGTFQVTEAVEGQGVTPGAAG